MLAAHDGDDDALALLLAGLDTKTLVSVVGEVAGLADAIWSTRSDCRATVRPRDLCAPAGLSMAGGWFMHMPAQP